MFFGSRRPRNVTARPHDYPVFQPRGEQLEAKILMAIDLGGTAPPALPLSATAPFGIDMAGTTTGAGAGYSVADVADLTGKNLYDSLVIGAPGVTGSPPTTVASTGTGTVYVEFGSSFVQSSTNLTATQNWLNTISGPNLAANDRVGNLSELGTTAQTNPISTTPIAFPFTGVTFTGPASFGKSVAGVTLSSGRNAILIGAPNANGGSGAAYLISGNFAADAGMTINVASPPSNLNVVTFVNTATYAASGALGFSVAGGSNILGDGAGDVILGAPNASVAPTNTTTPVIQNTGVVYLISAAALSGATQTIDVSTLLTAQAIDFQGVSSGDRTGVSVADAGNVNGANGAVDDLLIGAPSTNAGAGAAYLVYGGSNLAGLRTTVNNIPFLPLTNLAGGAGTGKVPGATFVGPTGSGTQSGLGFSVSAGGDFNADGFGDILLGSPTWSSGPTFANQGEVFMFYGAASTSGGFLTGLINLNSIPANFSPAIFYGAIGGDLAGYSISQTGVINKGQPTGILIGAPGSNGNQGTAYLIPGRANFSGDFLLSTISSTPTASLVGLQFVNSTPGAPAGTATYFGASVSGRLQGTQTNTVDLDNEADFIIGAPGYNATANTAGVLAGGAEIVETGFLVVPIPQSLTVTVQIGVNTPFAPFSISATTPAALQIFVFGSTATTPSFMPVKDIDPTTVKVNGIAFPTATLAADPNVANHLNGIVDAIITISPRSLLALVNGSQTFTITGQTLATSPLPNFTWTGTATVTVTGGSNTGPSVAAAAAPATGPVTFTQFVSPFGANQYTPSLTALSALNYAPIPLSVATAQYLPGPGFRARLYEANHPNAKIQASRGQRLAKGRGTRSTLSAKVFDRGRFHAQKVYTFTHKTAKIGNVTGVLPLQARTESFDDDLIR